MDKSALIQKRNHLLIGLFWFLYVADTLFYTIVDQNLDLLWPPVGLILCIAITLLYKRLELHPVLIMVLLISSLYAYLFYINIQYPYLINYIFLVFGVIISAFYQSYFALAWSSSLAIASLLYFSVTNGERIVSLIGTEDFPYFILLTLFTTIVLFFMIKYANALWERAYLKEQKAKEDLQSKQSFIESFFKNSKDAIVVLDLDLTIIEQNDSFVEMFQLFSSEKITQIITLENGELGEALQRAKRGKGSSNVPLKLYEKFIEATISPVYNQEAEIFAISMSARDLTEKLNLEEYVRNSEKLKVTGEIAAGIAHEIRNPLTVISGFIQMMNEQEKAFGPYYPIIQSEISRMNAIISEFLLLSKPNNAELSPVNVSELINEVVLLYQSQAHLKNVEIIQMIALQNDMILGEGNQLKQVLINVFKNAFEALPNGGQILLTCRKTINQYVSITIEDTGNGIPEDVVHKIGTPFFTTKSAGTGLGIMISKQIIAHHKGTFTIENSPNRGVKVEILLPLVRA
jgi:signal transduction histidine kinase